MEAKIESDGRDHFIVFIGLTQEAAQALMERGWIFVTELSTWQYAVEGRQPAFRVASDKNWDIERCVRALSGGLVQ